MQIRKICNCNNSVYSCKTICLLNLLPIPGIVWFNLHRIYCMFLDFKAQRWDFSDLHTNHKPKLIFFSEFHHHIFSDVNNSYHSPFLNFQLYLLFTCDILTLCRHCFPYSFVITHFLPLLYLCIQTLISLKFDCKGFTSWSHMKEQ